MAESGEEWELSKENIRPIQQGRKQKVLKVALASHPEEVIAQQRQAFENELRTYSGSDPLFVWCKYIKWVEQNFPKGGREGHIKQLMERCLSILKDEEKYFDDDRFIDIMLKYAGVSVKPLEVYNYMYSNNIGCKSAKFFINWSWELEQLGNMKRADEVLTEGMQHNAQPFEKMKSYHADFEIRFITKIKANLETNNFESENGRSAFAMLKPQKKNLAPVLRTGDAVIEKKTSLVLNRLQPQPKSVASSSKVPFKIYDAENINPSLPVQTQSVARNIMNPENYKENERKPGKWNKVKVKSHSQSSKSLHESNPDFKFHCDDEKDEQICTPRSVPKTSSILSTRRRTPSPPIALFEPPDPMKVAMYPKNKVYGGAEEYSLEEIRAAAWLECKKKIEQERLLIEQQKKIKEQAIAEEKLKKQVEYLAKKVELLQKNYVSSRVKSLDIDISEVKFKTTKMNEITLDNQEGGSVIQDENRILPQYIQNNSKCGSSFENNLYYCNSTEKTINTTANNTEKTEQQLYKLHHSTNENELFDFSNQFNKKCTLVPSKKNLQTDEDNISKQSSDILPFSFYHDPTTKIIPLSDDIISSKESADTVKLDELHGLSENSDKVTFKLFHDLTKNHDILSQKFANSCIAEQYDIQKNSEESSHKLPFAFYSDSTENIKSNEVSSSKIVLNQENSSSNLNEESSHKLPFAFYSDPTEIILSKSNEIASSKKVLNQQSFSSNLNEVHQASEISDTYKESNENLPLAFFHDSSNRGPNSVERELSVKQTVSKKCPILLSPEVSSEEDIENIPPKGYVQDANKRELAGILEPSKNILFIPLEEQELDDDNDSEFEDYIYQKGTHCVDDTLIPPSNTEQFSTAKFLASTPCVSKSSRGFDLEKLNHQEAEENITQCISLPAKNTTEKIGENTMKPEQKSFKEPCLNSELKTTCCSRLPNILSVIMETSSENYSKSSSGSSASLTKSNHLDQNSAYQMSMHKQQSKLEPFEPSTMSCISEVSHPNSELNFQNISVTHKADIEKPDKKELYLVDFDPFDQKISEKLLKSINLSAYNISNISRSIRAVKVGDNIQIENGEYFIENIISEGAYAKVYKAIKLLELNYSQKSLALKVCRKANEWEFYICCELQKRLQERRLLPDIKNSVMTVMSAIKYSDGILLVNEYGSLGTLLDVINFYKKQNSAIPELLVMFFTLEILHIVSRLHYCGIIHGDIKPDNFLLRSVSFEDLLEKMSETTTYLRLIDFGRAIDLNLFDKGVCFTTTFSTNHFKCNEMKDQKPWVFQLDWYGVLSCIHSMLFLEYMSVTKKNGIWAIEKKFKRYWFTSLWEPLFNKLLNIPECYEEPDIAFFTNMIETKLQQNASTFISQLSRFSCGYS